MRLVTWNVQWCCGLDQVVDVARIVREARAFADFDVLCLQEVAVHFPGLVGSHGEDQVAELAAALPGYHGLFGAATDLAGDPGSTTRTLGCPASGAISTKSLSVS